MRTFLRSGYDSSLPILRQGKTSWIFSKQTIDDIILTLTSVDDIRPDRDKEKPKPLMEYVKFDKPPQKHRQALKKALSTPRKTRFFKTTEKTLSLVSLQKLMSEGSVVHLKKIFGENYKDTVNITVMKNKKRCRPFSCCLRYMINQITPNRLQFITYNLNTPCKAKKKPF